MSLSLLTFPTTTCKPSVLAATCAIFVSAAAYEFILSRKAAKDLRWSSDTDSMYMEAEGPEILRFAPDKLGWAAASVQGFRSLQDFLAGGARRKRN